MVSTLLRSALREIRQSLGRFLAILAIVGLGVGFFAGLRMCQPSMAATGVKYLDTYRFYDFRLLSTLGFTRADVEAFGAQPGIEAAWGSVYTEFLRQNEKGEVEVLVAHALTPGVNDPEITAGRMPSRPGECLGDASYFTQEDIGRPIRIAPENEENTLDLLSYDAYTLVGLATSPLYLNFERGTASIGSGSIGGFVLIPEEGFDLEAYHEVYLKMENAAPAYSDAYQAQADAMEPQVEELLAQRAYLRYDTLYADAMEEIHEGERELSDGWEEYRTERSDAETELADAYRELLDGEAEYRDGLAEYEQGRLDYAEGLGDLEQGKADYAEGLAEFEDGKKEYEEGLAEYEEGLAEIAEAEEELAKAKRKLSGASSKLDKAEADLAAGEDSHRQLTGLYQSGEQLAQATGAGSAQQLVDTLHSGAAPQLNAAVDQALRSQGSSLDEFLGGWSAAEEAIGTDLSGAYLDGLKTTLEQGRAEYEKGRSAYSSGRAAYRRGLKELEEGKAELEEARVELEDAKLELADAEKELADAWQEILDGEAELSNAKADLEKAPGDLADARRELDDGWQEYEDGLAEAEREFADAEAELAEGETEIAEAYADLGELKEPDTYTLTRKENTGYACFENDTAIIAAISLVFPVFFFLVAALVCMTTMKRMVDEQRTQIGVLKAIGYSNGQIIGKYLFYSGSAAITGSVLGYALGSRGLPLVIWEIYNMMYDFAPLENVFDPVLAAVSFAAALLCSMGATYLSCRVELRRGAAELLRPKAPKSGKRVFLEYITPLWKRMSFLRKVSVRNVLRYRSRLVMMVLGIGGCTALLVTGFGIRDSIADIANDQYGQITLYDYAVDFQEVQTAESAEAYLMERGWSREQALLVHSGSTDVFTGSESRSVYLIVPTEDRLEPFISLHDGQVPIPTPKAGEAVINRGLAQNLSIAVGDTLLLRDGDLGTVEVTVSGICDNYMFHYVYVSPETYLEQLGGVPEYKTLLVLAHEGADPYGESVTLAGGEGVSSVTVSEAARERVTSLLERLNILIVVVVACAGALAFIVLYNLTNINITERIREIATIKVLGFYQKEVAAYVFREITMLSSLGGVVGLGLGRALHAFVMEQVKVEGMFFPCRVAPESYAISFALTMLFTVLITRGMRPRLRKIDMAESLKSIE